MKIKASTFEEGIHFHKESGKYVPNYKNFLTQKQENIGYFSTPEEAKKALNQKQFEFFKDYSHLLPRWISLHSQNKKFKLELKYKFNEKWKPLYLGLFDTVQEAEQAKIKFISSLL